MSTGSTNRADQVTPSRSRRQARSSGNEREQAILATAKRLLGSRTIHEISIEEITKSVGISRSAFYFYFSSKEDVLLSLLDRVLDETVRLGDSLRRRSGEDTVHLLHRGIATSFQIFLDNRAVMIASSQAKATNRAMRGVWNEIIEHWIDRSTRLIQAEQRSGAAPRNFSAEELAISLNLMNERAMFAACADDGPHHDVAELAGALLQVWLRNIYQGRTPSNAIDSSVSRDTTE